MEGSLVLDAILDSVWQVADDLLRETFKQHEYGDVILSFVALRRLDCVAEDCKDEIRR
ncbi:MAG: hypothetical protein CMI55_01320 [Parcubacteria group bacterium]|jgi:type I restriction enzyme M protein|nr:hypothetical protein [Parcubacteria group bacterium]